MVSTKTLIERRGRGHLFKGRAREQKNRPAEALAAYRLAFEDAPYAQSATVSLAAALVTRMLAMRPAPPDPWSAPGLAAASGRSGHRAPNRSPKI